VRCFRGGAPRPYILDCGALHVDMITTWAYVIVNRLSLSSYNSADLSLLCSDVWGPCAGRSGPCCGCNSNSSGRLGLRRSGLMSIRFTRRSSPGPRRDDLANYWAHGLFVRSFILPVDPGDIRPPHMVSWNSKKQTFVALSTTEVEYVVAGQCCAQLLWMRQTLRDFGYIWAKSHSYVIMRV
jgi:hypothetical protein